MRVIAGEFRSRKLKSLPGVETRPTPDRLRETLFNILAPRIPGTVFLDAYAGTGAVGIEALSRGARRAIFVDRARAAAGVIRENLEALGISGRAEVFCGKATQVIERVAAGIVFLDPPYELEKEYESTLTALGSSEASLVIAQHARKAELKSDYGALTKVREVRQGDNALSFFEPRCQGERE
ncbi:MAG: 16S rRNA (guanine(966)-N(2))-methyltransferase RsmD [Bryobacteraceae bacterium]